MLDLDVVLEVVVRRHGHVLRECQHPARGTGQLCGVLRTYVVLGLGHALGDARHGFDLLADHLEASFGEHLHVLSAHSAHCPTRHHPPREIIVAVVFVARGTFWRPPWCPLRSAMTEARPPDRRACRLFQHRTRTRTAQARNTINNFP